MSASVVEGQEEVRRRAVEGAPGLTSRIRECVAPKVESVSVGACLPM